MRTQNSPAVRTSFLVTFLICSTIALFFWRLARFFIYPIAPDQISYLVEAQRVLSGVKPYSPHLAEVSPPLIIWFSSLPVLLGRWMHGSPVFFLRLLVTAMIFGSIAWCVRIMLRSAAFANPVAAGLLGCAVLWIEFMIGPFNFGQREHLLVVLILPYVLATATGAVDRLSLAERCALGVAAGMAIWFKPQDTLILVGLELVLSVRARSLRRVIAPEFLAMVSAGSLVLALVYLTTGYLKAALPLLVDTYWAFGTMNTVALALSLRDYTLFVAVMLLAIFLLRKSLRDPATPITLLICSLAASFAYDIQHTNWAYHAYPHQALLELALVYLLIDLFCPVIGKLTSDSRLINRMALVASALMAVLLCFIAVHPRILHPNPTRLEGNELDRFLAQYKPSTTVYVFSTSEVAQASAYNHGLNWGSRFAHLWMLPAIIQNELGPTGPPAPFKRLSPEKLASLASLQRTESAEDLDYWRPSVVLVQQCTVERPCQGLDGKDFNMISWFQQGPQFTAAWSHYQQQAAIDGYDVYQLVQ
jgi:hypothetical protein